MTWTSLRDTLLPRCDGAVLPHLKEKLEHDGTTTIVTLSINGHNINLT